MEGILAHTAPSAAATPAARVGDTPPDWNVCTRGSPPPLFFSCTRHTARRETCSKGHVSDGAPLTARCTVHCPSRARGQIPVEVDGRRRAHGRGARRGVDMNIRERS
eukprot:scaffold54313_cov34-Tisochrysis_lutea.AAC.1